MAGEHGRRARVTWRDHLQYLRLLAEFQGREVVPPTLRRGRDGPAIRETPRDRPALSSRLGRLRRMGELDPGLHLRRYPELPSTATNSPSVIRESRREHANPLPCPSSSLNESG